VRIDGIVDLVLAASLGERGAQVDDRRLGRAEGAHDGVEPAAPALRLEPWRQLVGIDGLLVRRHQKEVARAQRREPRLAALQRQAPALKLLAAGQRATAIIIDAEPVLRRVGVIEQPALASGQDGPRDLAEPALLQLPPGPQRQAAQR
jgi:hypothetical protein